MSRFASHANHTRCPEEILSYLPLVANGTCPPEKRREIEAFIEKNPDCARELEAFIRISEAVIEEMDRIPVNSEDILEDVLSRIEHAETPEAAPAEEESWVSHLRRLFSGWVTLPRLQVAMAVAVVLIVIQSGIILHQSRKAAFYHTLSGTTVLAPGEIALKVIFIPHATMENISRFLRETRGKIIAGPGPGGVFTLSVPRPEDPETFVRSLKARKDLILFAEISG